MSDNTKLVLFLTWDVSLDIWKQKGLLQREVKLYQALARRGVDVTFLSWGGKEDEEIAKNLLPEIKTIPIYNHIPRPKNKILRALSSLLLPWALRNDIAKADILKTNQMWGSWVAVLSQIFFRKPLIVRCGFELYDFTKRQKQSALRQMLIWIISRVTYGAANHICVATQEDKEFVIKNFQQTNKKISVHPNWIDTELFAPQESIKKENHILFVGRLSEQKNLPTLLDALQGTDITLDIVGDGEQKENLTKLSKEKRVNINFLGACPNNKLPAIYNSYPIFILPSHYEGNPKTLLEAMACGAAVIGTDVPGISSVIDHQKNGILCSSEKHSMQKAIKQLLEDKDLRTMLGKQAREQIVKYQTLDKLTDKELACYQSL